MMYLDVAKNLLRASSPHFQRSINLSYDTGNADYIAGYIPTPKGVEALTTILSSVLSARSQRSHVLHAAYGSGKSLLGLVLSAYASRDPQCKEATAVVQERLDRAFPKLASLTYNYLQSNQRLLPIILTGNEGTLVLALAKALARALIRQGITGLRLDTQFQVALDIISSWQVNYPDTYHQLESLLLEQNDSLQRLQKDLSAFEPEALALFEQLYPTLTAGAQIDNYAGIALDTLFHSAAKALRGFGYTGILVIWDEFGRYLDVSIGNAFGSEAAQLQSFAEFCNRSGEHQVHLVLITHRLISGYAAGLPQMHQQEWARIAERFRTHDVSTDPSVTYRLIAEALGIPDSQAWQKFVEQHYLAFDRLTARSLELLLFNELDDTILRKQIIEQSWPLHPLTVYALPRLSGKVAQNERTLFTFLASDEPGTLTTLLPTRQEVNDWWLIGLDALWDYFADAIRSDIGPGGAHTIWSGAMYALSKTDVNNKMSQSLIKSLAVLLIVSEVNVQTQTAIGRVMPTTDLLAWSLSSSEKEVLPLLEALVQLRAVVYRRSDGYWTFTRGSDIDLDAELSIALIRHNPTRQQIRQILEKDFPLAAHLPHRYNQEHYLTRFFRSLYRWPDEIKNTASDLFLKQLGDGYADGAVTYVLATNPAEREEAIETIQVLSGSRVLYVVPDQPLLIMELVRELFALYDLSNNSAFMQQDERLGREIAFLVEDVQRRLMRALEPLVGTEHSKSTWWWYEDGSWASAHLNAEDVSQLLSDLSENWFRETPVLNNELVNQHTPSGQQERAMERVIDVLLNFPPDALPPDFNLVGRGPDWLITRTLLVRAGLIYPTTIGSYVLKEPDAASPIGFIWNTVQKFLASAVEQEQDIVALIDKLQSPPLGLRRGVLPVLLAAMMRFHLPVLTFRHNRKFVSPITGQTFIMVCKSPEEYTIELSPWDMRRSVLWDILGNRVKGFLTVQERAQQPFYTLSIGLLRWLQSQPRYCRDTNHISPEAQQLRNLIRKAQREPAQVLAYELLDLLDDGNVELSSGLDTYRSFLEGRASHLMDDVATAYQRLLYTLGRLVGELFAIDTSDGHTAIYLWLQSIEHRVGRSLETFRFSDQVAQKLVQLAYQENTISGGSYWDQLSKIILGIALSDWNDQSYESFKRNLLETKSRVEHEIFELATDEAAIKLSLSIPAKDEQTYRFRQAGLSPQGQRILQNFKSTLEIAGRPLSLDEKRQIVLALLDYVIGNTTSDD